MRNILLMLSIILTAMRVLFAGTITATTCGNTTTYSGFDDNGNYLNASATRFGNMTLYNAFDNRGNFMNGTANTCGNTTFYSAYDTNGNSLNGTANSFGNMTSYNVFDNSGNSVNATATRCGNTTLYNAFDSNGNSANGSANTFGNMTFYNVYDNQGGSVNGTVTRFGNTILHNENRTTRNRTSQPTDNGFDSGRFLYDTNSGRSLRNDFKTESTFGTSFKRKSKYIPDVGTTKRRSITFDRKRAAANIARKHEQKRKEERRERQLARDKDRRAFAEAEEKRKENIRQMQLKKDADDWRKIAEQKENKEQEDALNRLRIEHGVIQNINGCEVMLSSGGEYVIDEKKSNWHCGDWVGVYDMPQIGLSLYNEKREDAVRADKKQ